MILASTAIALLAVTVAVATVGYIQTKDELTTRTTERDRIARELAISRTQRTELEAKLKATEAKVLDPKGYESIKICVKRGSEDEQAIRSIPSIAGAQLFRIPADALPPGLLPEGSIPIEAHEGPTEELKYPCMHGEPYLK